MDDVIVRPRLAAGLAPFVALEIHGHASGVFCEAGLASRLQDVSLDRYSVGELSLFSECHCQRLAQVKSLLRDE